MQIKYIAVYEENTIIEYLKSNPDLVETIYINSKIKKKIISKYQKLFENINITDNLKHIKIPIDLSANILGIVKVIIYDENYFFENLKNKNLIVILDHIKDPRNFGAIIRSANFFGIHDIIIAMDRQALITETVMSTARGGLSQVNITMIKNINRFIDKLKKYDFWIVGADISGKSINKNNFDYEKTAMIFGSEKGISMLTKKKCDILISILPKHEKSVQSLNVSVASSIFFYHYTNFKT
jgi:23S rRNA (guanosine2251-2'-O)-methyltransferase